jgi:hypothetical protein
MREAIDNKNSQVLDIGPWKQRLENSDIAMRD